MTDKYKRLAKIVVDQQEYFVSVVKEEYFESVRHSTWLLLMGLMETEDTISDD